MVSMDVETIAVIKKNKNYRDTSFVFGLIIFFLFVEKVMDGMYNIVNDPEIFILETA